MNTNTDNAIQILEKAAGRKLTLGATIWAHRRCEEISQTQFAKILGVSKQYLCDLEHDRKNVSPQKAAEFADRLGHPKRTFIRLAVQDQLAKAGLYYEIHATKVNPPPQTKKEPLHTYSH